MSKTISGTVTSRAKSGRGIKMNGEDQWYNGPTDMLMVAQYRSEVTIEVDSENNILSVTPSTNSGGSAPAKKSSFGGYDDGNRQAAIIFQSSRRDAIEFVNNMVTAGVFVLPNKQADKYGAYKELVEAHTAMLYTQAMGIYNGLELEDVFNEGGADGS